MITNNLPTHKKATIDHIMSTSPVKMANVTTVNTHLSDHLMVCANRLTKEPVRLPRFTIARAYHNINYHEMIQEIN